MLVCLSYSPERGQAPSSGQSSPPAMPSSCLRTAITIEMSAAPNGSSATEYTPAPSRQAHLTAPAAAAAQPARGSRHTSLLQRPSGCPAGCETSSAERPCWACSCRAPPPCQASCSWTLSAGSAPAPAAASIGEAWQQPSVVSSQFSPLLLPVLAALARRFSVCILSSRH